MLASEKLNETIRSNEPGPAPSKCDCRLIDKNGSSIVNDDFKGLEWLAAHSFTKLPFEKGLCHGFAHT
jgi:hypothetical protein